MAFHSPIGAHLALSVGADTHTATSHTTVTDISSGYPVDTVALVNRAPNQVAETVSVPNTRRVASQDAQGVAALDPHRDMPVEFHKRKMTPIGAPSSPMPVNVGAPGDGRNTPQLPYRSPLASSFSGTGATPWSQDDSVGPASFGSREAYAHQTQDLLLHSLNESLEALQLGPAVQDRSTQPVPPPPLPVNHHLFHSSRMVSPYEQKLFQKNTFANEGRSAPSHYHRDMAPRSRSILLRNVPPGVDDESLRLLLGQFGEVRDLGAQQRIRGGRGSVVATFFDLRHALAAVSAIDGSIHFGRRIEARFHNAGSSTPLPRSPLQMHSAGSRNDSSGSSPLDGMSARHSPYSSQTSPHQSPTNQIIPSPTNQGTLVVFNLDPNTTAEEIRNLFGSVGDVKEIRATPNKRHHKFVEFYDVRDAERALQSLNKTEVGGKKIKIEISRPGGRGSNNMRNNASHNGDDRSMVSAIATSQAYSVSRTPPSAPLSSISLTANAGHSQPSSLAISPLDRRLSTSRSGQLSPYSAPYSAPPFVPNDMNSNQVSNTRMGTPRNLNPGAGNTLSAQGHPFFPAASTGVSHSPSGFYNSMHRQHLSPYSNHGVGNGPTESTQLDQFVGDAVPSDYVRDVDQHGGLSRSLDFHDDRLRLDTRSAGQTPLFENSHASLESFWSGYSVPGSSPESRLSVPDGMNLPSGSPVGRGLHNQVGIGRFLGALSTLDNGYEVQAHTDDVDNHKNPEFSPRSYPQLRSNSSNLPYTDELNFGAPLTQFSDGARSFAGNTSPTGKERPFYGNNVNGTVSPFPYIGSSPQDRIGNDASGAHKDTPRRKYSTVLQMNVHEVPNRRSNPSSNRPHVVSNNHGNSNSKFTLDIEKVISSEDNRTALMIRNIPNKYNQRMLLSALEDNHRGHYDFIYLPIDFKNKCNVGYAFINFTRTEFIPAFYTEFHGHKWGRFNSEKVCEITYARIQGKSNLIGHFQNSSLMNEDPKCRPVVFDVNGKQQVFPVGSNVRTRRGPSARDASRLQEHAPTFAPLKQRGRCN